MEKSSITCIMEGFLWKFVLYKQTREDSMNSTILKIMIRNLNQCLQRIQVYLKFKQSLPCSNILFHQLYLSICSFQKVQTCTEQKVLGYLGERESTVSQVNGICVMYCDKCLATIITILIIAEEYLQIYFSDKKIKWSKSKRKHFWWKKYSLQVLLKKHANLKWFWRTFIAQR